MEKIWHFTTLDTASYCISTMADEMVSTTQPTEFVRLWSDHARHVYAYIFTLLGNWADADDVFQETSVVLIEKFDQFRPGSSFRAWACSIAYLKALEQIRRRSRMGYVDDGVLKAVSDEFSQFSDEMEPRLLALSACMEKLSVKDRQLVGMRYQDSGDVREIAGQLGRSAKAIYKSLARIHESLFDCIRRTLAESER